MSDPYEPDVIKPDEIEQPVIQGGKRLGLQWCPWMGDWFSSWNPDGDHGNAQGSWYQWAYLAAKILKHPFTYAVAPELFQPDIPTKDIYLETNRLSDDVLHDVMDPIVENNSAITQSKIEYRMKKEAEEHRVERENDEALDVIRELRQKLALAGVEGSPPPFETTIGRLERELGVEKFKLARLVEAAEEMMGGWTNVKTRDKLRACLMNIYEAKGKTP